MSEKSWCIVRSEVLESLGIINIFPSFLKLSQEPHAAVIVVPKSIGSLLEVIGARSLDGC